MDLHTKQHLQEPYLDLLKLLECSVTPCHTPYFTAIAQDGLDQDIKQLALEVRFRYAELLASPLQTKHGPSGCLAQILNGRCEALGSMPQDSQVLELRDLLNHVSSVGKRGCATLARFKDQCLGLVHIHSETSSSTKGLEDVKLSL